MATNSIRLPWWLTGRWRRAKPIVMIRPPTAYDRLYMEVYRRLFDGDRGKLIDDPLKAINDVMIEVATEWAETQPAELEQALLEMAEIRRARGGK